jgi:hypothetical protein
MPKYLGAFKPRCLRVAAMEICVLHLAVGASKFGAALHTKKSTLVFRRDVVAK